MGFTVNTKQVEMGLAGYAIKVSAALKIYGETVSKKLETQAKQNRPWTDRTNRARLGLTGSSEVNKDGLRIVLAHTVDYGVWLELAHEKRFAIVEPTVKQEAAGVKSGLNRLLNRITL